MKRYINTHKKISKLLKQLNISKEKNPWIETLSFIKKHFKLSESDEIVRAYLKWDIEKIKQYIKKLLGWYSKISLKDIHLLLYFWNILKPARQKVYYEIVNSFFRKHKVNSYQWKIGYQIHRLSNDIANWDFHDYFYDKLKFDSLKDFFLKTVSKIDSTEVEWFMMLYWWLIWYIYEYQFNIDDAKKWSKDYLLYIMNIHKISKKAFILYYIMWITNYLKLIEIDINIRWYSSNDEDVYDINQILTNINTIDTYLKNSRSTIFLWVKSNIYIIKIKSLQLINKINIETILENIKQLEKMNIWLDNNVKYELVFLLLKFYKANEYKRNKIHDELYKIICNILSVKHKTVFHSYIAEYMNILDKKTSKDPNKLYNFRLNLLKIKYSKTISTKLNYLYRCYEFLEIHFWQKFSRNKDNLWFHIKKDNYFFMSLISCIKKYIYPHIGHWKQNKIISEEFIWDYFMNLYLNIKHDKESIIIKQINDLISKSKYDNKSEILIKHLTTQIAFFRFWIVQIDSDLIIFNRNYSLGLSFFNSLIDIKLLSNERISIKIPDDKILSKEFSATLFAKIYLYNWMNYLLIFDLWEDRYFRPSEFNIKNIIDPLLIQISINKIDSKLWNLSLENHRLLSEIDNRIIKNYIKGINLKDKFKSIILKSFQSLISWSYLAFGFTKKLLIDSFIYSWNYKFDSLLIDEFISYLYKKDKKIFINSSSDYINNLLKIYGVILSNPSININHKIPQIDLDTITFKAIKTLIASINEIRYQWDLNKDLNYENISNNGLLYENLTINEIPIYTKIADMIFSYDILKSIYEVNHKTSWKDFAIKIMSIRKSLWSNSDEYIYKAFMTFIYGYERNKLLVKIQNINQSNELYNKLSDLSELNKKISKLSIMDFLKTKDTFIADSINNIKNDIYNLLWFKTIIILFRHAPTLSDSTIIKNMSPVLKANEGIVTSQSNINMKQKYWYNNSYELLENMYSKSWLYENIHIDRIDRWPSKRCKQTLEYILKLMKKKLSSVNIRDWLDNPNKYNYHRTKPQKDIADGWQRQNILEYLNNYINKPRDHIWMICSHWACLIYIAWIINSYLKTEYQINIEWIDAKSWNFYDIHFHGWKPLQLKYDWSWYVTQDNEFLFSIINLDRSYIKLSVKLNKLLKRIVGINNFFPSDTKINLFEQEDRFYDLLNRISHEQPDMFKILIKNLKKELPESITMLL